MRISFCILTGPVLFGFLLGCVKEAPDKPLAPFQIELLDMAMDTATAIPVNPHIKDRSKAQEGVVVACLNLDQPKRAQTYLEKIDNWVKGSGYADLAYYCAKRGYRREANRLLDLALKISETTEDWRKDHIRVKIGQARVLLGQTEKAESLEAGVDHSEKGKVARTKAALGNEASFDEQMKALDALIAPGQFDEVKNALQACAELFNRFYADIPRRSQAEEKIKASWSKLPIFVRMDLLNELVNFALDHADQAKAMALVDEEQTMMDSANWPVEERVPRAAKLAALRSKAGDKEKARKDADAVLALFESKKNAIVNIWRAGALRPLAEAYQAIGDADAARSVYKTALLEGMENPNSRPRAEDLSATCVSMASVAVEPDAKLWEQIRQIRQGLRAPW